MRHNEYIAFFEDIARRHYKIRHEQDGRNAFFRINSEVQMHQALATDVSFPALVLLPCFGSLSESCDEYITGVFEIRKHVSALSFSEVEDARDECKQIGLEIIAYIHRIAEEEGHCGPIASFNPANVRWDFTGPVNQSEFGCMFVFTFKDPAFNPYTIDLDNIFPELATDPEPEPDPEPNEYDEENE